MFDEIKRSRRRSTVLLLGLYFLCLLEVFHGYQLIKNQGKNFYSSQQHPRCITLHDSDKKGNDNDNNDNKNKRSNDDEDDSFKQRLPIKERSLLREYFGNPTFPTDAESETVFPPQYIIDEIKERDSLTIIRDPPEGWETFERNDPRWLLAPMPSHGQREYIRAYARHSRWIRALPSLEQSIWRENALFSLKDMRGEYDFNLNDYVTQGLITLLDDNAQKALEAGDEIEFKNLALLSMQAIENEKDEVVTVINNYYDALSRRDRKAIARLWLPDPNAELILPGRDKARGVQPRLETYKLLNLETKSFGRVTPKILSVECFGNVAFVHTLDDVGLSPKAISKGTSKGQAEPKPLYPKRLFSTTVLRFANKQWRIMIHHTMRFRHSSFTGDLPEIVIPPLKRPTAATSSTPATSSTSNPNPSGKSIVELLKNPIAVPQPGSIEQLALEELRKLNNKEQKSVEVMSASPSSSFLSSSSLSRPSLTPATTSTHSLYPDGISVTKKAIITLRYLVEKQLLTKTEKDMLVNHIIDCISEDKKSSIETAFNVLFGNEPENLLKESFDRSVEEFCDQCHEILLKLKDAEQELQQQQLTVEGMDDYEDDSDDNQGSTKNMKMKSAAERLSRSISGIFKKNNSTKPRNGSKSESGNENKKRGRKDNKTDNEDEQDEE